VSWAADCLDTVISCSHNAPHIEYGTSFTCFSFTRMIAWYCEICWMLVYHALYLDNMTEYHLREKLACLYDVLPTQILELYLHGPSGIHILVTDHVSAFDFILWLCYAALPIGGYIIECLSICLSVFPNIVLKSCRKRWIDVNVADVTLNITHGPVLRLKVEISNHKTR